MSFLRFPCGRPERAAVCVAVLRGCRARPVAAVPVAREVNRQLLAGDDVQVGQRPPALVQPEPVPGEELVRDGEPDVVERHVVHEPSVGTVEERHGREARRAPQQERAREEVQRQAGVDDILDDQHVTPDDRGVQVLQQPDRAGAPARVGGELEEVDGVGDGQGTREVREEDRAGLERRDEQRLAARIRGGQLGAQLADAARDLAAGQVDLPDRVTVSLEEAG